MNSIIVLLIWIMSAGLLSFLFTRRFRLVARKTGATSFTQDRVLPLLLTLIWLPTIVFVLTVSIQTPKIGYVILIVLGILSIVLYSNVQNAAVGIFWKINPLFRSGDWIKIEDQWLKVIERRLTNIIVEDIDGYHYLKNTDILKKRLVVAPVKEDGSIRLTNLYLLSSSLNKGLADELENKLFHYQLVESASIRIEDTKYSGQLSRIHLQLWIKNPTVEDWEYIKSKIEFLLNQSI